MARDMGIKKLGKNWYEVRVAMIDPKTGETVWPRRRVRGNKRKAEAVRDELAASVRRGEIGTAPLPQRLADFAPLWLASKALRVRPSTAARYADALAHVLPFLGQYDISRITAMDIEKWLAAVAGTASPATINGWLRVLRACLKDACADLNIVNPTDRVKPLPEPPSKRKGLTAEELKAFLDAYDQEETKPLVTALALTGARWGEISSLRWENVDFANNVIHIRTSHWHGNVGATKSGKEREVPMCDLLADTLRDHQQRLFRDQDAGWKEGWCFATVATRGKHKGKVRLRFPSSIKKPWDKACKAAGVTASPHSLRRSFVDLLRLAKVDALVEHAVVGHCGEDMRARYSTIRTPEAAKAVAKVARLVRGRK